MKYTITIELRDNSHQYQNPHLLAYLKNAVMQTAGEHYSLERMQISCLSPQLEVETKDKDNLQHNLEGNVTFTDDAGQFWTLSPGKDGRYDLTRDGRGVVINTL